jgi:hypothetical protein
MVFIFKVGVQAQARYEVTTCSISTDHEGYYVIDPAMGGG